MCLHTSRYRSKLPCSTLGVNYGKGYTQNRLEVHTDAFSGSDAPRVVIIDDVIASGKTMVAAVELVGACNVATPAPSVPAVLSSCSRAERRA